MQIELVEVRTLELPLVEELATSVGAERRRPVVLVRVLTDLGEGWGECVALAEPTYSEEHASGAVAVLVDHLVPRLLAPGREARPPRTAPDRARRRGGGPVPEVLAGALSAMAAVRGHRMAKAALEMALLDAFLVHEGRSLASFLGATRAAIPAGATIGLARDPGASLAAAGRAVAQGYGRVKCKVAPGRDVEPVAAVRGAFPDLAVSVDANGAYRLEEAGDRAALAALDGLGLVAIEQPLAPDDLVGHARLAAELETPVLLDESIRSLGQLETAAALRACDGVSVKPGPLGGLLVAAAVHDRCGELGLACAIGGMLETGLGRAASIALGALPGFSLPGDLGASDRYFVPDLTEAHVLVDGELPVPSGPGLGVSLDRERVLAASRLAGALRASR